MIVIIHNIRSTHNVGSIFRTSDAAGVSKIYLTGYTPGPLDRFNRPVKEIAKTALGAEQTISWETEKDFSKVAARLQHEGFELLAIEQSKKSQPYFSYTCKKPIALIVGNEVEGLEESVLKTCDAILEIPMFGEKESLNVSVAFGIVAFGLQIPHSNPKN